MEKEKLAMENQRFREIIKTLGELKKDIKEEFDSYSSWRYDKLLDDVIEKYKREVRRYDALLDTEYNVPFDDYTPINFSEFLRNFGDVKEENGNIIITPKYKNLLEKKMTVMEDDGMGYCAKDPQLVFQAGTDDKNDINIWI